MSKSCCTCCDGGKEKKEPTGEEEEFEVDGLDIVKIGYLFHYLKSQDIKVGWYPWITQTIAAGVLTFIQIYLALTVHMQVLKDEKAL